MRLPQFTAESSIYTDDRRCSQCTEHVRSESGRVTPALMYYFIDDHVLYECLNDYCVGVASI